MSNCIGSKTRELGIVLPLFAFVIAVVGAFAAFGFDLGLVFSEQRQIHFATDSAALAGVQMIKDGSVDSNAIRTKAEVLASENGINIGTEITSITIGQWDGNNVNPSATPPDWDAVEVLGVRQVDTFFGRLAGINHMDPKVRSVALLQGGASQMCPKPFGVETSFFPGLDVPNLTNPYQFPSNSDPNCDNHCITVTSQSAGNWGKIEINGVDGAPINMSSAPEFCDYMIGSPCQGGGSSNPPPLCAQQPAINSTPNSSTGGSALSVFTCLIGQEISMLIVDAFGNGNKPVTILRHARAEVLDVRKNGQQESCSNNAQGGSNNWEVDFNILELSTDPLLESGGGGAPERLLVR